jgi:hypothetical protein
MAWFRTNRGIAAWLAFFALACQLMLTFGHIHVSKFDAGLVAPVAAAQTGDTASDTPPSPPNGPDGQSNDFCAVCANISLASTLIIPLVILFILAPDLFTYSPRWSLAASEPASFRHRPFSARGPPHT